jgi:hypothetical protein
VESYRVKRCEAVTWQKSNVSDAQLKKDFAINFTDAASAPIPIQPDGYFPASNLHCLWRRFSLSKIRVA